MRHVLDTTGFSAAMKGDAGLMVVLKRHHPVDFAGVSPVVAEIEYGIRRLEPASRKALLLTFAKDRLLSVLDELPWTPEASVQFGKIKADMEHRECLIDDFDVAIAAIAMAHDCGIISADIRRFSRINGLSCRHWR